MDPPPAVLDYAPRRQRKWNWAWLRPLAYLTIIGVCAVAGSVVGEWVFPPRWNFTHRLQAYTPITAAQVAVHLAAINQNAFLAPIAQKHGMSLAELRSRLTITAAPMGSGVDVTYLSDDQLTGSGVPADIVGTYGETIFTLPTPPLMPLSGAIHRQPQPRPESWLGVIGGAMVGVGLTRQITRSRRRRSSIKGCPSTGAAG